MNYWILDGRERAYELRDEIKNHGGKWNPLHRAWEIQEPPQAIVKLLRAIGLVVQPK